MDIACEGGRHEGRGRHGDTAGRWRAGRVTLCLARAVGLGLVLAGAPALAESRTLSITATRADDTALPADAVLDVELLDVSRADAPSKQLASQRFRVKGWPALIRLPYDGAAIDPRMEYRVAARLVSGDRVILRTTTAYPVLTRGASDSVRIVLDTTEGPAAAASPETGLSGVTWEVGELGGRALVADDPPTLTFLDDGSFAMFGGCNRFRGKAQPADGRVAFPQPIAGTMKMCPPLRMELEKAMLAALGRTTGYQRNGLLLAFTDEAGVVVMRFRKAPR